ncbi:MAG: hypothetical protein HYV28_21255 [Ignavibacteriales bacterium]|nr:hypothetical protein [Ignavibacteriales bacterium]
MIQSINSTIQPFIFTKTEDKKVKINPEEDNSAVDSAMVDSAEISNTAKAFSKVEKFLDMNNPNRLNINDLNDAEKEEFLKMLVGAIKEGVVGYEVLEVNGLPEKHFLVNEIGDKRLNGAKPYKKNYG